MTLIEVLAGLALLGGLLAAVVVSASRHTRQVRNAQDRLQAVEVADRLLTEWLIDAGGQIPAREGTVADREGWRWRVSGRIEPALSPFGCHAGRLEIIEDRPGEAPTLLTAVEFVSNSAQTALVAGAP